MRTLDQMAEWVVRSTRSIPALATVLPADRGVGQLQQWITLGQKYGVLTGGVKLSQVYYPISA